MAMDIRVIEKSECLLCPATKRENDTTSTHTAFLEILSFAGTQNYQEFFREVAIEWIRLGGVPNWCKQWTFLDRDGIFEHIRSHYGSKLTTFESYRQNLSDPMFLNKTMEKLLVTTSS